MAANDIPCCQSMFWVYVTISAILVAFAGLMSGLTLGLMSLSLVDLEVLSKAGQPKEQKNAGFNSFNLAAKILPIVKNQHLLLCTLLICNAMAMEALPVFLDSVLSEWSAILISVTLILVFSEIIPQAVCSRYGLSVGAKLSVVVRLLVILVFPIAYPISKGHSALLRRAELKTFVGMHGNEAGKGGELTHDETTIISGALDLTQKTAKDAMTPMTKVFSIDMNSKLDDETMTLIMSKGHSRVPVYSGNPTNIVGLFLVKNLIKCRPEDETPIRNLTIRRIPRVQDCLPLYDILNEFQKGQSHMAAVVHKKDKPEDTAESAISEQEMVSVTIMSNSTKSRAVERASNCQYDRNTAVNIYKHASSVASSDTEARSPALDIKITDEALQSITNSDEDIVGIITMEDVLEELLQEPILDETDYYVDVHDKIKINMLPSLLKSPGAASHLNRRILVTSPLSSAQQTPVSAYHRTPVLRSPVSPYIQSPFVRPTLSASPGSSLSNSPATYSGVVSSSPSSHRVSRKSYEKLRRPGDL
ncbi:hypothetical protein LguiA_034492 [Lonicera macranthoides]